MTQHDKDLQDAEALLPWYLNGSLSAEEQAMVERALASDPALQAELASLELMRETVRESSDSVAVPASDFDLVMQRIDGVEEAPVHAPAAREPIGSRWLDSVRALFAMPGLRFAAVAAALVIMLQSAAIVGLMVEAPDQGAGYQTATSGEPAGAVAAGPRLLLMFQAEASLAEVAGLLGEVGARIVDGPSQEGAYIVELGAEGDLAAVLKRLQAREDLIRFAGKAS